MGRSNQPQYGNIPLMHTVTRPGGFLFALKLKGIFLISTTICKILHYNLMV